MWRNYLTVGLRSLMKSKTYAFINIFGLALGLAACLMILLYVRYELSYDEWVPNAENIYQLQTDYVPQESGEDINLQMSSYVAGAALQKDFSQVEKRVYIFSGGPTVIRDGQAFSIDNAKMVDGPFFDIFTFPFVHGDSQTALQQPGSVVLSETEAKRFFGPGNPVGETLTMVLPSGPVDHRVTGVMRDLPDNTHMRANMVVRFDPTTYFAESPEFTTSWGWQSGWVYVALKPGSTVDRIHAEMPAWERRNIPDFDGPTGMAAQQDYRLVNIRDVHLGDAQRGAMSPGNDRTTIITFAMVAVLVLAMACVNFVNLATARASQRAREVALRKVLGANRGQLVLQFLGESILLTTLAMLLALAAVELLLPLYATFLDADMSVDYWGLDGLLLPAAGLVLLVGGAGGLYPAFYLSGFQPATVLKANKSSADAAGSGRLRNMLVIGQFAISIGLIICTAIVYSQTSHVRELNPGYDRDGLVQVNNIGALDSASLAETMVQTVSRLDGVTGVTRTNMGINTGTNSTALIELPGRDSPVEIGTYAVDFGFFDTMGIDQEAGRRFDPARPADDSTRSLPFDAAFDQALAARGLNIVVNALAAERMGFADPQDAIGKQVRAGLFDEEHGAIPLTIIGVVENSRFRSAREPVQPILFLTSRNGLNWMLIRYDNAAPDQVRDEIEKVWERLAPDVPFSARFSEDIIADLYRAEEARARTFAAFALLAIVIACLGLFGLAAFTAERRTKEIGIRKVLGAKVRDIVKLLAWQFSKPVVIANLIAWPVAWWVMRDWLNTFDARIALGPTPFLLAGLLALVIAVGTVSGHAIRVARTNPIHALRYE